MKVRTPFPKQIKIVPAKYYTTYSMDAGASVSRRVNIANTVGYQ